MVKRRNILEPLTRARLIELARTFELPGLTGRPKDAVIDVLARKRSVATEALLDRLKRDELKAICRAAGLLRERHDREDREAQLRADAWPLRWRRGNRGRRRALRGEDDAARRHAREAVRRGRAIREGDPQEPGGTGVSRGERAMSRRENPLRSQIVILNPDDLRCQFGTSRSNRVLVDAEGARRGR